MAGETPGAAAVNRNRALRQSVGSSTDKIYASGNISVFDTQVSAVQSQTTRRIARSKPSAVPAYGQQVGIISHADDINAALEEAISRAQAVGQSFDDSKEGQAARFVVYVAFGNSRLMQRTRAALDSLKTRAIITDAQYKDIAIRYGADTSNNVVNFTKKVPEPVRVVPVKEDVIDPEAFLHAEDDTPVMSTDSLYPTNSMPSELLAPGDDDDDDDDDNDVELVRKQLESLPDDTPAESVQEPVPEPIPEPTELPASQVAETESSDDTEDTGNKPKHRGRRSGRGSN